MSLAYRLSCSLVCVLLLSLVIPAAAQAAYRPAFQVPFACGESWQGSTRPSHSPSSRSIDWNRDAYDEGHIVVASAPGVVDSVIDLGDTSYGLYIVVDHGSGWSTVHAHLLNTLVVAGQHVDAGQALALLGNSGGSSGAHLHYEQRIDRVDQWAVFGGTRFAYDSWLRSNNCPDVPVVGDWTGRGRSSVGVFHRGAETGVFRERHPLGAVTRIRLGLPTDSPVVGDWDGNGRTDVGVWRTASRRFTLATAGSTRSFLFGHVGDVAVSGDWDGNGTTEVGLFRPATATFLLRSASGAVRKIPFGGTSSLPISGDWNGDGVWQVGVYEASTATFRLAKQSGGTRTLVFGSPRALPAVGSWDTSAATELGVWEPATAAFVQRLAPGSTGTVRFGHTR
jgi:hypothetical protein